MSLAAFIQSAKAQGASDVHLEPGLPPAWRVDGALRIQGDPISGQELLTAARELIGEADWPGFLERRSFDLSRTIAGARCRVNILQTARGVGMAIRLLVSFAATLDKLNLHPDLRRFARLPHGLVLVSGPTGCGKSTTLAAMIQEINLSEARHIVTVESPIEYTLVPRRSLVRQREVGRDTPSFEQALIDALREDPDVLMVGEMRDPATMRLTLNAAETGHLVFATVHSSTTTEALQRVVSAFPAEVQNNMRAALADCLQAVVCQRLRFRLDLKIRVPECEVLVATHAVRNFIRQGDFFKIHPLLEMGAEHGMWTFQRYQRWLDARRDWATPAESDSAAEPAGPSVPESKTGPRPEPPAGRPAPAAPAGPRVAPSPARDDSESPASRAGKRPIEIEPVEGGLAALVKRLSE